MHKLYSCESSSEVLHDFAFGVQPLTLKDWRTYQISTNSSSFGKLSSPETYRIWLQTLLFNKKVMKEFSERLSQFQWEYIKEIIHTDKRKVRRHACTFSLNGHYETFKRLKRKILSYDQRPHARSLETTCVRVLLRTLETHKSILPALIQVLINARLFI